MFARILGKYNVTSILLLFTRRLQHLTRGRLSFALQVPAQLYPGPQSYFAYAPRIG